MMRKERWADTQTPERWLGREVCFDTICKYWDL